MKYFCDLHIHSALSPCAENEMTPKNIVNLASLLELDIIAVCDHNSVENACATVEAVGNLPLCAVAGMELETSENVHFVCLFEDTEVARSFDKWLFPYKPKIKNRPEIFSEQLYMNAHDEITGIEENLLVSACDISIYDVKREIDRLPAVIIPAHVDRSSYSIISNLGFIPEDLDFATVEISQSVSRDEAVSLFPHIAQYNIITGSDAHRLENMFSHQNPIELSAKTPKELIRTLKYAYK